MDKTRATERLRKLLKMEKRRVKKREKEPLEPTYVIRIEIIIVRCRDVRAGERGK